jgi:hypothetical protein
MPLKNPILRLDFLKAPGIPAVMGLAVQSRAAASSGLNRELPEKAVPEKAVAMV